MLLLTIAVISVLFILSYLIFDRDLLAPPTAVALVFLFGTLCCFYNEQTWGLNFSANTLGLIATCIIATMIGGVIGVLFSNFPKKGSFSFSYERTEPQEIQINAVKTWAVLFIQLLVLYMLFRHIRSVTGYSSWITAVARYRAMTTRNSGTYDAANRMSFLLRNMEEASRMVAFIYAYIVGNNLVASKKKISINWLPMLVYTATAFVQGGRANMIRIWVVLLIVAYTVHKRSIGWRKSRETKKVIRTMVLSIIAVGAVFAASRELVGRSNAWDPLYYVTFYAGSPTAVLDQFWVNPIEKPEIWGRKTFYYLNQTFSIVFGSPERYNYYSDFVKSPIGISIGNAPTALRDPYTEFGYWGFLFLMIAFGAFYTLLYCRCRRKRGNNPIDFHLLIYAYISYVFLMYFYASFNDYICHVILEHIIEWLVIRWALVGWRFKQGAQLTFRRKDRIDSVSN